MTRNYHAETAASITALARRIMYYNLCKEIALPASVYETFSKDYPKTSASLKKLMPKYQFSRAKWYVADYDWVNQAEVLEWCRQQFGPHPQNPDAWSRWCNHYSERVHFRDEKDYNWFVLRWGA